MIIIKALNGDKLRLTTTRLTEIDHDTEHAFHTTKEDLKKALKSELDQTLYIEVHGKNMYGKAKDVHVFFDADEGSIGCKTFSKYTFNKILRTMGLKRN